MPLSPDFTFHVSPQEAGASLVQALRRWMPDRSWSQVRRLLNGCRVAVNHVLCLDEGRRLTEGEVVEVFPGPLPRPRQEDVLVHHLDEHVVVVEKPAGLASVRHRKELGWPQRRKERQPTLMEILPKLIAEKESRGPKRSGKKSGPRPVKAVHRIDRDTSGLLVFARTAVAERNLMEQFRSHAAHRLYLAVVCGNLSPQTIASRLVRDRGDGRRGSADREGVGKRALTHVRPLERFGDYTLVECRLETGRTHQIRIHLAEQGHPVCGEKVYNRPLFGQPASDESQAPRLALHAAELGFVHPVRGDEMRFEAPLPEDLRRWMERLRGT